ncbi:TPA: hypothetical protein EYP13_00190 [Candidatus Micrarchaeota archaeon]|nr:hypothetical protein [Candidatus Micrarchaeota archaeon]
MEIKSIPLWERVFAQGERFEIRFCKASLLFDLVHLEQMQSQLLRLQKESENAQAQLPALASLNQQIKNLQTRIKFENYIVITGCRNLMTRAQSYQNPSSASVWLWRSGWWRRIEEPMTLLQRQVARIRKDLRRDPAFAQWEETITHILDVDIIKICNRIAREILPNTTQYKPFTPEKYAHAKCYPVFCRGKHFFVYADKVLEKEPNRKHHNLVGIPWTPQDMPTPALQKWMDDIFDPDTQRTVWQVLAWVVTPVSFWPHVVFLVGDGGTGKSTFLKLVRLIVGGNNVSAVPLAKLNPNSAIRLTESLVNLPSEGVSTTLPEDLIKAASDQEPIEVRPLYRDFYTATPVAKLVQAWNRLPPISDVSQGIWRRLVVIPFEKAIPNPNPFILSQIRREIPGILHRLIYIELPQLLRQGGRIYLAQKVRTATMQYKEESSAVLLFFEELKEDPTFLIEEASVIEWEHEGQKGLFIQRDILYACFVSWCTGSGLRPLAKRNFMDALKTLSNEIPHTVVRPRREGGRPRYYFFPTIQNPLDGVSDGVSTTNSPDSARKDKQCGPGCEHWVDSIDSERCVREGSPGIKVQTGQTCLYLGKDTLLCVDCTWFKSVNGHASCVKTTPPTPKAPRSKACHAFIPLKHPQ